MGGAGAPTGFARTFPMRDDPLGRLDPTSEREDQQIRFWEQAKGLRDSRRFAVGFSHVSTLMPYTNLEYAPAKKRILSPISKTLGYPHRGTLRADSQV